MNNTKILIVEDEALIGAELSDNIMALGYRVTQTVNSGEKALASIKADRPDLVLMDIQIKGDMDGIHVAEIIKADNGPPVIFLTAYLNDEFMNRAKIIEPFGYLIKPVDSRELHSTIEITLYKASMEKERNELLEKLRTTQKELQKARSFIPICAKCKKIRDDKGYWEEVEAYAAQNFSVSFTHGICPDCMSILYPEFS
ncbi:MAG: response regulator [Pseudomonadota bacterium]